MKNLVPERKTVTLKPRTSAISPSSHSSSSFRLFFVMSIGPPSPMAPQKTPKLIMMPSEMKNALSGFVPYP